MNDINDDILKQLNREIDQIITPLRASPRRKSTMREELLAHLLDIYASESAKNPTPSALTSTLRRFGHPAALSNDLQSPIPIFERFIAWIFNKEFAMQRLWLTLLLTGIAALAFGLSIALPALAKLRMDGALRGAQLSLVVAGAIIMFAGAQICCWGIVRKRKRRPDQAAFH